MSRKKSRSRRRKKSRLRGGGDGLTKTQVMAYSPAYKKAFGTKPSANPSKFTAFVAKGISNKTKQAAAKTIAVNKLPVKLPGGSMRKRRSKSRRKRRSKSRRKRRSKSMRKRRSKSMRKRRSKSMRKRRSKSRRKSRKRMRGGVLSPDQIKAAWERKHGTKMPVADLKAYLDVQNSKRLREHKANIDEVNRRAKAGTLSADQIKKLKAIKARSAVTSASKPSCEESGSCSVCSIM